MWQGGVSSPALISRNLRRNPATATHPSRTCNATTPAGRRAALGDHATFLY